MLPSPVRKPGLDLHFESVDAVSSDMKLSAKAFSWYLMTPNMYVLAEVARRSNSTESPPNLLGMMTNTTRP
jgi:hypothetical protein